MSFPRLRRVAGRLRARLFAVARRRLAIAPGVIIGPRCRLIVENGSRISLERGCEIDEGTVIAAYRGARVTIGSGAFIGHHCTIAARTEVVIGEETFLAELVSIRDHDHQPGMPPGSGSAAVAAVNIGRRVWLGAKVTVLRGSSIGDDSVVGANAVVRGVLPSKVVAVGVPARVVRSLEA